VVAGFHRQQLEARSVELGGGFVDGDPERPVVDAEQHVAGVHGLVVVHIHLGDAAGDVAADRRLRDLNIGIVGGFVAAAGDVSPRGADGNDGDAEREQRPAQPRLARVRRGFGRLELQ